MSGTGVAENIRRLLSREFGPGTALRSLDSVSGGDAASAFRLELEDGRRFFCKYAPARNDSEAERFAVESLGLELLAEAGSFVVPEPIACTPELLLLPWLDLCPPGAGWQERFGRALALMQQNSRSQRFGFACDNWLGASVQLNGWFDDWTGFWLQRRLLPQQQGLARLLPEDDPLLKALDRLATALPGLLDGVAGEAVLLHGDLWSGNAAADAQGRPVIMDPAAYYGHREAEFGMMRLFGGFGPRCEAAYREVWPFDPGFNERLPVYLLHHQLNHLLLFGSAYYHGCLETLRSLL